MSDLDYHESGSPRIDTGSDKSTLRATSSLMRSEDHNIKNADDNLVPTIRLVLAQERRTSICQLVLQWNENEPRSPGGLLLEGEESSAPGRP